MLVLMVSSIRRPGFQVQLVHQLHLLLLLLLILLILLFPHRYTLPLILHPYTLPLILHPYTLLLILPPEIHIYNQHLDKPILILLVSLAVLGQDTATWIQDRDLLYLDLEKQIQP